MALLLEAGSDQALVNLDLHAIAEEGLGIAKKVAKELSKRPGLQDYLVETISNIEQAKVNETHVPPKVLDPKLAGYFTAALTQPNEGSIRDAVDYISKHNHNLLVCLITALTNHESATIRYNSLQYLIQIEPGLSKYIALSLIRDPHPSLRDLAEKCV